MENKFIAVYGTLRSGQYNNGRFGDKDNDYIHHETKTIKNKRMVVNGLPYCSEGKDSVVFDLIEVKPRTFEAIERMEIGAGYTTEKMEWEMKDGKRIEAHWWSHPRGKDQSLPHVKDFNS